MSKTLRVEVALPYVTDMPGDVSINTFHLLVEDGTSGVVIGGAVSNILQAYTGALVGTHGNTWGSILSPIIKRTTDACSWRVYDLADAKPRPVYAEGLFTLDANSDPTGLPMEVAIAVSYNIGTRPAGWDPRSTRGRIYLGPLNVDVMSTIATSVEGIATNVRSDIAEVAHGVAHGIITDSAGLVEWALYSRKHSTAVAISAGFVDNEFDTQRRRGVEATARSTWTTT